MFIVYSAAETWRGADAVTGVWGPFDTEQEALDFLADIRDDDPERGNGWSYMEVWNPEIGI